MRFKGVLPLVLVAFGMVLLASPAFADDSSQSQSILDPAGPQAQHISDLWFIVLVPALFVLVFVGGAIIYAAFRFRAKDGDTTMPKQIGGNNALEFTWTLIPAMILMGIFIVSALQVPFVRRTPTEAADAIHVQVIGSQWIWNFRYTGLKNAYPATMIIPADEVVNLDIDSKDVIHSFAVPRLAGRLDAIPGKHNTMWIQAKPGTYYGQCTEFCGKAHAGMTITVRALPRPDFDRWYASQPRAGGS